MLKDARDVAALIKSEQCGYEAGKVKLLIKDLIVKHWDDLLRLTASLKTGWATAWLLIGKLQSFPPKNDLTRALQEYGKIKKTEFILRYLLDNDFRRRINRQLNKGESLHSLRRFLLFANEGNIRKRFPEEQQTCTRQRPYITSVRDKR